MSLTRSTRLIACLAFLIHALTLSAVAGEIPPITNITTDGLRFNYLDTPFNEIVNQFAAQTGRSVIGPIPTERFTVDCGREVMDFKLAMMRLGVLSVRTGSAEFLWHHVELDGTRTIQMRRMPCFPNRASIFVDVSSFAASHYEGADWAMLLQDCRYSPSATIAKYQALLPSYVIARNYPEREALTLFAAAADLRLYSPLLDMLDIALQDDAAVVADVKLQHVEPAVYAEVLRMFLPGTIEYQRLEQQRYHEPAGEEPPLRVWTDWAHRRAVVVGSPFAVGRAETLASMLDQSCFPITAPHAPSQIQPRP